MDFLGFLRAIFMLGLMILSMFLGWITFVNLVFHFDYNSLSTIDWIGVALLLPLVPSPVYVFLLWWYWPQIKRKWVA